MTETSKYAMTDTCTATCQSTCTAMSTATCAATFSATLNSTFAPAGRGPELALGLGLFEAEVGHKRLVPAGFPAGTCLPAILTCLRISPLRKTSLSLPVIHKDPVLGTSVRLSLSLQVTSGLNMASGAGKQGGYFGGLGRRDTRSRQILCSKLYALRRKNDLTVNDRH